MNLKMNAKKMMVAILATITMVSCKKEEKPIDQPTDKSVVELSGTISGNRTLDKDSVYLLKGFVRVGEDLTLSGTPTKTGILTIEPGTVILGDRETKGTLIIHRGSRILAEGTADNPIIFTSEKGPGLKNPGDWGGVVICGKATNNFPGGSAELEGGYGAFHGGSDDADNSGKLKYVRIEYAGIPVNPNQEINSLTMGSVGSGTQISYVQCSYGGDDAFEWFGGTVNCDHLMAYRCLDDDMDCDNGFRGNVQFVLSVKDNNLADQSGSNGFEVDNDGSGSTNTPITSASFSNVTLVGPKQNRETILNLQFQNLAHLRRGSKIKIYNSVGTAYPNGIFIDGTNSINAAKNGELVIRDFVLAGVENWGGNGFGDTGRVFVNAIVGTQKVSTGTPGDSVLIGKSHPTNPKGLPFKTTDASWTIQDWFKTTNSLVDKYGDVGVDASVFGAENPNVLPIAGSSLLSGADFTGISQFTSVAYKGAFGTTDWTTTWVEWIPGSKKYYE